jgi:SAP domain/RPEL repeat
LHEQSKQLQRAKTGDLLKAKIQSRPDRQELERRHILELQEGHIDPSLAEKRRMLEKALLADQLNSKISHRPGPLELIEKNILHTEEPIERIVKEGLVPFKAANEAVDGRPQHPDSYVSYEDDSQSSEGDLLPSPPSRTCDVLETAAHSAGITVALTIPTSGGAVMVTSAPIQQTTKTYATYIPEPPPPPPPPIVQIKQEPVLIKPRTPHQQTTQNLYAELCQTTVSNHHHHSQPLLPLVQAPSPSSLGSTTSSLSPLSSVASPPPPVALVTTIHAAQQTHQPMPQLRPVAAHMLSQQQFQKSDAPGKDKNRKKSKAKPMAKVRSIKFHEYKGPPNAQKASCSNALLANGESNYQLIMKQQYLLEYLEGIYKHPPLLPANQKPTATVVSATATAPTQILVSSACANNIEMMTVQVPQPSMAVLSQTQPPPASTPVQMVSSSVSTCSSVPPSPASSYSDTTIASELSRLNRMKVSDLKQQLKKLNLPVSGPKPQLIERLRPYLPLDSISGVDTCTEESVSGDTEVADSFNSPRHSMSPPETDDHESMDCRSSNVDSIDYMVATPASQIIEDDIVREQQKKIDELQRALKQSQEELEQVKLKTIVTPSERMETVNQKLKQQLEARINKEKMNQLEQQARQQKEHLAFQLAAKSKQQQQLMLQQQQQQQQQQPLYLTAAATTTTSAAPKPLNAIIATYPIKQEEGMKGQPQQLVTFFNGNQLSNSIPTFVVVGLSGDADKKLFAGTGHQRTGSLSGIVLPITTAPPKSNIPPPPPPPLIDANTKAIFQPHLVQREIQQQPRETVAHVTREQSSPPVAIVQPTQHQQHVVESQTPPPQYEEATKHLKNAKNLLKSGEARRKPHLMSQDMTDVLEILIKNGELPQSAADPTTPTPQADAKPPNKTSSRDMLFSATAAPVISPKDGDDQHVSYADDIPSSLLLDAGTGMLDLNVLSPMQQDDEHHQYLSVDDAFKMISQATPPPPSLHGSQQPASPEEVDVTVTDIISLPSDDAVPILADFNDLDLMEFQMDIEDDSQPHSHHQKLASQVQQAPTGGVMQPAFETNGNGCRRDMNPSLQPSLNDIIQQQQQQMQHNGYNYNNSNNNNNNSTSSNSSSSNINNNSSIHDSYVDTPMDFENLLANFDSGLDSLTTSANHNFDNILGSPPPQTQLTTNNYNHQLQHNHLSNHLHHQPNSHHLNYLNHHHLNHHSPHHDNILDLFNEDYRMTLGDSMSCEVDNLLCNI